MKMNCSTSVELKSFQLKILFTVACWLMTFFYGYSQLIEDPHIAGLMDRWKTYNLDHQEVTGWRIQILATVDRRQMESVRRGFENRYPEYPIHFVHNEPYLHLKVGAFMTMQKAQAFLKKMQHDYPQAIPVTDLLKMDELILYDQ